MPPIPHINRIATATPPNDVHAAFLGFAHSMLPEARARALFDRLAGRAGIGHRWSFLRPAAPGAASVDADGFYRRGAFPGTGARMHRYASGAVALAEQAVAELDEDPAAFTHLVAASCTGFMAPGLDQVLAARLGMNAGLERTAIGFMGCYAAVNALRTAYHIVRSDPAARVLVLNVELCTLHLQETPDMERLLTFMLFGDGCSAALVSAEARGAALLGFRSRALPGTADLITWHVGDDGFDMHLGGAVPSRIGAALRAEMERNDRDGLLEGRSPEDAVWWAVHAGGRTVLDAVETALRLPPDRLAPSRAVLDGFGNMSSATVMFILAAMLRSPGPVPQDGVAMAFGPGLCAETFRFRL